MRSTKFDPPDAVGLNEIRVAKEDLRNLPVRKIYFPPDDRRKILNYLRRKHCVTVYGGRQFEYVMRTAQDILIRAELPEDLSFQLHENYQFEELPSEIARRFLFGLIEKAVLKRGYVRGEGWQLYSPNATRFEYGHYAVNVGIRDNNAYYSIFLDPTVLVLIPLTKLTPNNLAENRLIRKLVSDEDKPRMSTHNFSTFPGRAGYFVNLNSGDNSSNILPDTTVILKPKKRSDQQINYPAFALRIVTHQAEFNSLGLDSQNARKHTQPLAKYRLHETRQWVSKIFPHNELTVNDRSIPVDDLSNEAKQAIKYHSGIDTGKHENIYYPPTALLFDSRGTKTNFSQKPGLKQHGPFDQDSQNRPFDKIKPYLILPGDEQVVEACNKLMAFLNTGYERRKHTSFPDDTFEGFNKHFRVEFQEPGADDIVIVEDAASLEEYFRAARAILNSWASENENNERIVVVIIPSIRTVSDSEDPYSPLKKLFVEAGLPSQMLEIDNLHEIDNPSNPFGHLLWTFALDLYVKMGGKPWTLARPINNVNCLIGLGFGRSLKKESNPIYVGIANIFDQGGQWLDLNSNDRELDDEEWQSIKDEEQSVVGTSSFKLHQEMTISIISDSLASYNTGKRQTANRVILHKNGEIYESEALGFLQALSENILSGSLPLPSAQFALVSVYKNHNLRMYGPHYQEPRLDRTITKGSVRIIDDNTAVIATTGKHPFGYSGIGTPKPLFVQRYLPSHETLSETGFNVSQMYSIGDICEQVLSLTRLHWGATNDIRLPITSEYAQRIAKFLANSDVRVDYLLKSKRLWWI